MSFRCCIKYFMWLEIVLFPRSFFENHIIIAINLSDAFFTLVAGKLAINYQELAYLLIVRPAA